MTLTEASPVEAPNQGPFVCPRDRWTVADEWFASFIRDLQASAGRVTRLRREAGRGVTAEHRRQVEFEKQTEQYLRYLRHEMGNNAAAYAR